jgi:drug/metabolite transporter (DMT)-like permease
MNSIRNRYLRAHGAVFTANFLYGINFVIAKDLMVYMNSWAVAFCRIVFSMVLLWLVGLFFRSDQVERKDMARIAVCGFLGICVNQSLFMKGLSMTSPVDGSIIVTLNPLIVMVFSLFMLREKITLMKVTGMLTGCAGVLLLVTNGEGAGFQGNLGGNLLLMLNTVVFGLYLVLSKPLMMKYDSLTVVKWMFLWGAVFYMPFGAGSVLGGLPVMPASQWWALGFVVVCTTLLTYFLNMLSMKTLRPTTVSMYLYLQPLTAGFTAVILGVDSLSMVKIISAFLVFLGVYQVSIINFRIFSPK